MRRRPAVGRLWSGLSPLPPSAHGRRHHPKPSRALVRRGSAPPPTGCAAQGHSSRRYRHPMYLWALPGPCRDRTTCDAGVPDPPSSLPTPPASMVGKLTFILTFCQALAGADGEPRASRVDDSRVSRNGRSRFQAQQLRAAVEKPLGHRQSGKPSGRFDRSIGGGRTGRRGMGIALQFGCWSFAGSLNAHRIIVSTRVTG